MNHLLAWSAAALFATSAGCSAGSPEVGHNSSAIVYGRDDRVEFYQVAAGEWRSLMAQALVALVPKAAIVNTGDRAPIAAASLGEVAGLCVGERFAEQPSAAFCSGILLDQDLVLTAGHCARVARLDEIAVVFDYYYEAPGVLALKADTPILGIDSIVAEALDDASSNPRLDYAWLRLQHPVDSARSPAAVALHPSLSIDDPVVAISTSGGTPLKLDQGARARSVRATPADFFTADTDTLRGSSGGAVFNSRLELLGILARGGMDFFESAVGCYESAHMEDGAESQEQYTYASRAVEALCTRGDTSSALCRDDCDERCRAAWLHPAARSAQSCAVTHIPQQDECVLWWIIAFGSSVRRLCAARRRKSCVRQLSSARERAQSLT